MLKFWKNNGLQGTAPGNVSAQFSRRFWVHGILEDPKAIDPVNISRCLYL